MTDRNSESNRLDAGFVVTGLILWAWSTHFAPTYGGLCAEVLVGAWTLILAAVAIAAARIVVRLNARTPGAFARASRWVQFTALIAALVGQHVFVSINYLKGGDREDDSYEARGR